MNFRDAIDALNSVDGIDLLEQEQLEYLIGSNEGKSKLIISLRLDKYLNLVYWLNRNLRDTRMGTYGTSLIVCKLTYTNSSKSISVIWWLKF